MQLPNNPFDDFGSLQNASAFPNELGVDPSGGTTQNQSGDPALNDLFSENSSGEGVYGYPLDILRESNPGHFIMFQAFEVEGIGTAELFRATGNAAQSIGGALRRFQNRVGESGEDASQGETSAFRRFIARQAGRAAEVTGQVGDLLNQQGGEIQGNAIDQTGENNQIERRTVTQRTDILGRNKTLKDTVVLYMPPGVEVSYSANYNLAENQLGSAGRAIVNSFNQTGTRSNMTSDNTKLIRDAIIQGSARAGKGLLNLAGQDPGKVFGSVTRKVMNPHLEFLFETVGQRTFSYDFIFTPRNRDEMLAVHDIVRVFKLHMHPVFNTDSAFLTMPSEFDILFYSNMKENQYLNRIMPSVLTECKVSYMPNENPDFFADIDDRGQSPSQIKLTLGFAEVSVLDRRHIENGF